MLPSQDMQYLAIAIDMDTLSHLSKRSENILVENKSRLMDLRCKSDLNVMFVYWCRLFNASIYKAIVLGMAAMSTCWLATVQKSEYVHQSNLLVFSWVLVFWSRRALGRPPRPKVALSSSWKLHYYSPGNQAEGGGTKMCKWPEQTMRILRRTRHTSGAKLISILICLLLLMHWFSAPSLRWEGKMYRQCRGIWICDERVYVWHKA